MPVQHRRTRTRSQPVTLSRLLQAARTPSLWRRHGERQQGRAAERLAGRREVVWRGGAAGPKKNLVFLVSRRRWRRRQQQRRRKRSTRRHCRSGLTWTRPSCPSCCRGCPTSSRLGMPPPRPPFSLPQPPQVRSRFCGDFLGQGAGGRGREALVISPVVWADIMDHSPTLMFFLL